MNSNKHKKKIISILVFIAIICTFFSGCSKSSTNIHRRLNVIQSCSNADILDGGREIIAYDVDTGVMYLICNGHYKFGITALLGTDGKPLLYDGYDRIQSVFLNRKENSD